MIRQKPVMIKIPNKSVFEDVLTRSAGTGGYDGHDNFTPFDGMAELIQKQFNGSQRDRFNLKDFLDYADRYDFDPSKTKTKEVEEDGIIMDKESTGFTTLEDVAKEPHYVESYIESIMIRYKICRDSDYKQNKGNNNIRVFTDEEGKKTDERRLLEVDQIVSLDGMSEVLEKIPHLLKIIWNHSKQKSVHLISFLIAYEYITKQDNVSHANIRPIHFAKLPTYMLNSRGGIKKQFDHVADNKGEYYTYGRRWVLGEFPQEESYRAAKKLIALLDDIGCTFYDEDPLLFNEETIGKMICTYIPDNDEYIATYGRFDPEVANALEPGNLFRIRSELKFTQVKDVITVRECDKVQTIIDYINVVKETDEVAKSALNTDKSDLLVEYIKLVSECTRGTTLNITKDLFSFSNDILCYEGEFFFLDGDVIAPCEQVDNPRTVLHKNGLVLVFEQDISNVYYTTIEHAIELVRKRKDYGYTGGYWNVL